MVSLYALADLKEATDISSYPLKWEEKQVFQGQDKQVVERFMPMYTVLQDPVRHFIREGEDPSRLVGLIRDCRQSNAADAQSPVSRSSRESSEALAYISFLLVPLTI